MTTAQLNPYLKTKVLTASPMELRMLLYDGALRFLEQGKEGLRQKNYEQSYDGFSQCQAIVLELLNSLRPEHAPDLCDKLSGLYTFMYLQLVTAAMERDIEVAEEVQKLLEYERETWKLLMDQLQDENTAGASGADQVAAGMATRPIPPTPRDIPDDIIGGRVSLQG